MNTSAEEAGPPWRWGVRFPQQADGGVSPVASLSGPAPPSLLVSQSAGP